MGKVADMVERRTSQREGRGATNSIRLVNPELGFCATDVTADCNDSPDI